jgi:hypothetical protein
MNSNTLETAKKLGEVFAATLNGTKDAANWHRLGSSDNVPELDYVALSREFGECTREMKFAYRQGFNNVFNHVNRA